MLFETHVPAENLMGSISTLKSPYSEMKDTAELRKILLKNGFLLSSSILKCSYPLIPGAAAFNTIEMIRSLIWNFVGQVQNYSYFFKL